MSAKSTPLIALLFVWLAANPAIAGGSDDPLDRLQETLEAQQAQIEAQARQLEKLKADLERLKAERAKAPSSETAKAPPPPKDAKKASPWKAQVQAGNRQVELVISGQVNRMALFYDDGGETRLRSADNDNSSTRLRFLAKVKPNAGWTIAGHLEVELESNSSKTLAQSDAESAEKSVTFKERYMEVTLEHKRLGKLYLGQGDTASNKTSQADLSGTRLAGRSAADKWGGGLEFWDSTTGAYSGVSVHKVVDNLDGRSRKDRIRYDTPSFNGLKLAASVHEDGAWDLAAFYGQKIATVAIKAAVSFVDMSPVSDTVKSQYSGSLALRHNSGWNAAFSAGGQDTKGEARGQDPWFVYLKLGYHTKTLSNLGRTAFSLDYGFFHELNATDEEATVWGLQLVQTIEAWNTEIFAGWRRHGLDSPGIDGNAINIIGTGARLKF